MVAANSSMRRQARALLILTAANFGLFTLAFYQSPVLPIPLAQVVLRVGHEISLALGFLWLLYVARAWITYRARRGNSR